MHSHCYQSKHKFTLFTLLLLCLLILTVSPAFAAKKAKKAKSTKPSGPKVKIAVVDTSRNALANNQVRALQRAGASVSVITSKHFKASSYDGLVIPGGGDVTPKFYHEKKQGAYGCSDRKDRLQIYAINEFTKAGKPILGICRGAQIINVAFGGTLHQNIGGHMNSRQTVNITADSALKELYGSSEMTTHFHHQACKKMGRGLVANCLARDKRKTVEGFQHETLPIYGIQWHPEFMGSRGAKVYKKFVSICKSYKTK